MSAAPASASIAREHITGAVLAGGRGQRMQGADKGLVTLQDKPLVAHVLARLEPQVGVTVINANRNIDRYATFGHPVVLDEIGEFAGPLAGVHAVLAYATTRYVVTCPCDAPRLPLDLVTRLSGALVDQHVDVAVARTGAQPEPVFALYDRIVLPSLTAYLRSGQRKVETWQASLRSVTVDFAADAAAFRNINTPSELTGTP